MDMMMVAGHVSAEMPKRPRSPPTATRVIEVLAFPSVQLLDVTGPVQVFASANDFAAEAGATPPYELRVVTQAGRSVTASAGVELAAAALPPIGAPLDTLMIAGGQGVETAVADLELVDWVGSVPRMRAASHLSVPARSCWRHQVCWMENERRRTGPFAPNSRGAFPPYASSPIRSSCATVRSGHPPA